ncbi:MAG: AI-2E family transporter [Clostridiales bacterium]|nr:AI-2E family transporter [Clostridiales bacterium]
MRKSRFVRYISESLAGFGSLAMAILFFFSLYKLKSIFHIFAVLIEILMPLIYGGVIAFILTPLCNRICRFMDSRLPEFKNRKRARKVIINSSGVALSIIIAIIVVYLLLVMVLPQLFTSIVNLISNLDQISKNIKNWPYRLLDGKPELQQQVQDLVMVLGSNFNDWAQNTLLPKLQQMVSGVSVGIIGIIVALKNLVIGIIISIYLMFNRKLYVAQAKKVVYSILPVKWANNLLALGRESSDIFSGFIIGKLVDSAIIGVLCFIGMSLLKMPYTLLISVVIGLTNVIPYFGPIIGAIPCAFLVLIVSPIQCVYFVLFILFLQTLDGNVIGPKILGNSTGLSSFWVLFSLLLFGGIFGFAGMVIGVPCFAVIYNLIRRSIIHLLDMKKLPHMTEDYEQLDYIDPDNMELVHMAELEETEDNINQEDERRSWTRYCREEISKEGFWQKKHRDGEMNKKTDSEDGDASDRIQEEKDSLEEDSLKEDSLKEDSLKEDSFVENSSGEDSTDEDSREDHLWFRKYWHRNSQDDREWLDEMSEHEEKGREGCEVPEEDDLTKKK